MLSNAATRHRPEPRGRWNWAQEGISLGVVLAFVWYCKEHSVRVREFLTMTSRVPWMWEVISAGYCLKVALDSKEQVKDMNWAHGLTLTAINAFGGAFLAPLIVCHCPVPLMEETFLWMLVFTWYIMNNLPMASRPLEMFLRSVPGNALFTVVFAIFKTNQIVAGIELANNAIMYEWMEASSRYFKATPYAAPLLCGFLSGCGGDFLPFEKGLTPIEKGNRWPVRAAFFASVSYWVATRSCGVAKLEANMWICVFRALGDYYPTGRDAIINPATQLMHETLESPSATRRV